MVPSNLRLGFSASYCRSGLSAFPIVGGPFGPFLSIARNQDAHYSGVLQAARDHRPQVLGTHAPCAIGLSGCGARGLSL